MKAVRAMLAVLTLAAVAAGGLDFQAHQQDAAVAAPAEEQGASDAPVAAVQVAPLRMETVQDTLTALGTVEAAPGETQTFSVPFESRVEGVLAVSGQSVAARQALVEVEPSPDTQLQMDQARQERDAAKGRLEVVQQRQGMKLATRQDVLQAEQALQAAELRVSSLEKRGIDGKRVLQASGGGHRQPHRRAAGPDRAGRRRAAGDHRRGADHRCG